MKRAETFAGVLSDYPARGRAARVEWAARFYVAPLAERDGAELLRAAGLVE